MTKDNGLKTLITQLGEPIDPSTHSKEFFLLQTELFPHLEKEYESKLTPEFEQKVKELGKVYFIINHNIHSMNREKMPHIRLHKCLREEVPTISLDMR